MDFRFRRCWNSIGFIFVWIQNYTCDRNKIICKIITPSRGVAIELSSALVIIAGSRLKIPLSTTHCQVGATVGVGAVENPRTCGGINCKIFIKTALGWIITCVIVGLTSGLLTAQGVFSPSVYNYCPNNNHTI